MALLAGGDPNLMFDHEAVEVFKAADPACLADLDPAWPDLDRMSAANPSSLFKDESLDRSSLS